MPIRANDYPGSIEWINSSDPGAAPGAWATPSVHPQPCRIHRPGAAVTRVPAQRAGKWGMGNSTPGADSTKSLRQFTRSFRPQIANLKEFRLRLAGDLLNRLNPGPP